MRHVARRRPLPSSSVCRPAIGRVLPDRRIPGVAISFMGYRIYLSHSTRQHAQKISMGHPARPSRPAGPRIHATRIAIARALARQCAMHADEAYVVNPLFQPVTRVLIVLGADGRHKTSTSPPSAAIAFTRKTARDVFCGAGATVTAASRKAHAETNRYLRRRHCRTGSQPGGSQSGGLRRGDTRCSDAR